MLSHFVTPLHQQKHNKRFRTLCAGEFHNFHVECNGIQYITHTMWPVIKTITKIALYYFRFNCIDYDYFLIVRLRMGCLLQALRCNTFMATRLSFQSRLGKRVPGIYIVFVGYHIETRSQILTLGADLKYL